MDILFKSLTTWLAPIICFTAEEAWQSRYKDSENSVHLQNYFKGDKNWKNDELGNKWSDIRELRSVVTTSIEEKRKEGITKTRNKQNKNKGRKRQLSVFKRK